MGCESESVSVRVGPAMTTGFICLPACRICLPSRELNPSTLTFLSATSLLRSLLCHQQDWLAEAGTVPPGNGVEAHLWDGTDEEQEADLIAKMSPAERAAYEDKKLKLRKAMVCVSRGGRGGGGGVGGGEGGG